MTDTTNQNAEGNGPVGGPDAAPDLAALLDAGGTLPAAAVAALLGGTLQGDPQAPIGGLETLEHAGETDLTFIREARYTKAWLNSNARCVLAPRDLALPDKPATAVIRVDDVDAAVVALLQAVSPPAPEPGVHPTAVVHPQADIHPTATIDALCFVGPRVRIGAGTILKPGVRVLDRCEIGDRCLLHPGVVVGSDGFGFLRAPGGGHLKVPHLGAVRIGDDVEIGANSTIDRGKFGPTLIGDGVKIDNLVHIAHNCRVGDRAVICGCSGIAGSVTIGADVFLGGGVAVKDGLSIGDGAMVGGRSGVLNSIPAGETWIGYPACPLPAGVANMAAYRHLGEYLRSFRRLQRRLEKDLPDANADVDTNA